MAAPGSVIPAPTCVIGSTLRRTGVAACSSEVFPDYRATLSPGTISQSDNELWAYARDTRQCALKRMPNDA
jgi:hypothetical protein